MDSALHVIKCNFHPRFSSQHDVASTIHQFIKRILNSRFSRKSASYEASTIHQSLLTTQESL